MHFVGLTERGSNARSPPPVEKSLLVIARLTLRYLDFYLIMDNFGNFECPKSLGGDLELIGNSREVSFPILLFF